jgi:transcriptional regulator with XRE-family HTH domain
MTSPNEQRQLLGTFLRARRERLTPAAARVPEGSTRRRTPGLRREEVAQLCRVSPTWYTWLEQGRDVSVSPSTLARIADALHLTAAERAYVFELTRKRDPVVATGGEQSVLSASLVAALNAITAPAYVLDRRWQACGWNAPAGRLFAKWLGGPERNLLRYVFLDASARQFICDWERRARRLVAEFRADTVRHSKDADIAALVHELSRASQQFAQFWNDQSVLTREGGSREFNHPELGPLHYEQITLLPAADSGYKIVMLVGA